jgi:hypothetical protein
MNTRGRNFKKYDHPRIINEDTLSIMSDDQLKKLFIDLRSNINKNRRNKRYSKEREIEFCYVQRELQFRRNARQANKK